MGGFLPVYVNVAIGKHGTTDGTDANGFFFHSHLFYDFGDEFVNHTVRTARTIVHGTVVQERGFLIYQIFLADDVF